MSDEPERPTCRTCPYWDAESGGDDEDKSGCHRYPPRFGAAYDQLPPGIRQKNDGAIGWMASQAADFPATDANDWCGENPDFSSYIAARRRWLAEDTAPHA